MKLSIACNPKFYDAYFFKALALEILQRYEEAISDLTAVIQMHPEKYDMFKNRGQLYAKINKIDAALKDYDMAI